VGCTVVHLMSFFLLDAQRNAAPNRMSVISWNGGVGVGGVSCMPKGCLPPLFSVLVTASLATASGRARCKSQQRGDKGRAGKQISRVRDIKERWRVSRRNAFYARAR